MLGARGWGARDAKKTREWALAAPGERIGGREGEERQQVEPHVGPSIEVLAEHADVEGLCWSRTIRAQTTLRAQATDPVVRRRSQNRRVTLLKQVRGGKGTRDDDQNAQSNGEPRNHEKSPDLTTLLRAHISIASLPDQDGARTPSRTEIGHGGCAQVRRRGARSPLFTVPRLSGRGTSPIGDLGVGHGAP